MNKYQLLFISKLAFWAFSGCFFIVGCNCRTDNKEKDSAVKEKKIWFDPATLNPFMEYDKATPVIVNERVTRRITYLNDLMIVVVDITGGPQSEPDPFHAHVAEQTCYVAEGEIIATVGEKQQKLKTGDTFIVPSNVPHTVQMLTPTIRLIDTFHPVREDFLAK